MSAGGFPLEVLDESFVAEAALLRAPSLHDAVGVDEDSVARFQALLSSDDVGEPEAQRQDGWTVERLAP